METIIALSISLIAAAGALILHQHEMQVRQDAKPDLARCLLRPSRLPSGTELTYSKRRRYGSRK